MLYYKCIVSEVEKMSRRKVIDFIFREYDLNTPIFTKEIYKEFKEMNRNTIRSIINRLVKNKELERISSGIYALPNRNSLMGEPIISTFEIINKKYLSTKNDVVGYISGINFANKIGLTTQTASVELIISNRVSNKRREVEINNSRIIVNSPRVKITKNNYKLLQVLDILNNLDSYSELNFDETSQIINEYLLDMDISTKEIANIVKTYPQKAQTEYYRIKAQNVITSQQSSI